MPSPASDGQSPPPPQGLALSGGGIRSATFNLGLLQSLIESGVLRRFDYLSTVSGGAYIGAWLLAIIHREITLNKKADDDTVHDKVKDMLNPSSRRPLGPEVPQIHHLREYSSYLTPRRGLLSADTWTIVGGFFANFSLNLLVVVAALATLLALLQLHMVYLREASQPAPHHWPFWTAGVLLFFSLTVEWINAEYLIARMARSRSGVRMGERIKRPGWTGRIHLFVILPILASAWFMSIWLSTISKTEIHYGTWTAWMAGLYMLLSATSWLVATFVRAFFFHDPQGNDGGGWRARLTALCDAARDVISRGIGALVLTALAAGPLGGILLFAIARLPQDVYYYWCFPLVVGVYTIAYLVHTGITGAGLSAEAREWRVRLAMSLLRFATGVAFLALVLFLAQLEAVDTIFLLVATGAWLGLVGIAYIGGALVAGAEARTRLATWVAKSMSVLLVVGVVAILAGLAEGFTGFLVSLTKKEPEDGSYYILVFLLLVGGVGTFWLLLMVSRRTWMGLLGLAALLLTVCYVWGVLDHHPIRNLDVHRVAFLLTLALTIFLAWRIDVNEVSAHGLYRNRLGRCYLGASNPSRRANPFTDFDVEDDQIRLSDLAESNIRPYPIFNAALNLVRGDQLAWQDRMATSFVLTPLYCGYQPGPSMMRAGQQKVMSWQRTARPD